MKKLFFLFFGVLLALTASAQWKVRSVPNTRLQGNEIHVSDPDGYLSDSSELYINTALSDNRDQADVFLVALSSIGDEEPKHFATELFNYWGIGDAETDNGVLLLFVEDQHAMEFETGYGAEATLTDATCAQIFNRTMVPYFKAGDYEGGLCAGVADIVVVYGGTVPMGLKTMTSSYPEYSDDEDIDITWGEVGGLFSLLIIILMVFVIPVISFFRWIAGLLSGKKKKVEQEETADVFEQEGLKLIKDVSTGWKASVWEGKGFLRFLVYGVGACVIFIIAFLYMPEWMPEVSEEKQYFWALLSGWIGYFTATGLIQNTMLLAKANKAAETSKSPRNIYRLAKNDPHSLLTRVFAPWIGIPFSILLKKRMKQSVQCVCPTCGADMMADETFQLPEKRAAEEMAGGYHFTPCRCANGHVYVLREHGSRYSSVEHCKACGAFAAKKIKETTTVSPTYSSSGIKEITYECQYCHVKRVATQSIPRLTRSTSSGYHSSGHHSSGRSSGSFGGGRSGGGGYSGRW